MTDRIPTADELAAWRTLADNAVRGEWGDEEESEFIAEAVPRLLDAVDQLAADQDALGEALGWALLYLRTASDVDEEEPENMQKASDAFSAWFNARRVLLGGAS